MHAKMIIKSFLLKLTFTVPTMFLSDADDACKHMHV